MSLSVHINFNGQCKAAFEFYQQYLGGKLGTMLLAKDAPKQHIDIIQPTHSDTKQSDVDNWVVHASIEIQGIHLAGADIAEYKVPEGVSLVLSYADSKQVDQTFAQLSVNGSCILSPQKTFWSPRFAMLRDQFGVPWKLNC